MPNYQIPVPSRSAQAFHAHRGITNPGLIFDRFAPRWQKGGEDEKKRGLERVANAQSDGNLLREWNVRWAACARAANADPFLLKTDWRFVAGLGRKGPLEVGFTFHRYGFPILPGSSVKGIARAQALLAIARRVNAQPLAELNDVLSADGEEDSKERKKYENWKAQQTEEIQKLADDFRAVFGTTAVAGGAVFFDAIPASAPKLELDVMNPHFPQYYRGEAPPTDWQSPVPVYFLTVAPNTEFHFAVGWRGTLDKESRRLRDLAKGWLIGGLTELGAGAKTGAGYGYFKLVVTDAPKPAAASTPSSQAQVAPPKPPPAGALKRGEGRLRREGTQRVWIQDGEKKILLKREFLGAAFDTLPADKTDVIYEYDEVGEERRVWRIQRKPRF